MNALSPFITDFLASQGWPDAAVETRSADFSPRHYWRLRKTIGRPQTAILMQAPPEQKPEAFVAIAGLLSQAEISAPEIYAQQINQGLILLEDFGDKNLGGLIEAGAPALPYYQRAIAVLARLHQQFNAAWLPAQPALPRWTVDLQALQTGLMLDHYFPMINQRAATASEREAFHVAWQEILMQAVALPQSLLLRDYMLDNLMLLENRQAWRGIGVLDFQDGGVGSIAYDIASLCEQVRRDQPYELLDQMVRFYHQLNPAVSLPELQNACLIFAAQRHARILGIVAPRADKQDLVPRVRNYLAYLLGQPLLHRLRQVLRELRLLDE